MAKSFEVDMNGLMALEKRIQQINANLKQKVMIEGLAQMQEAANEAKQRSPIDTGRNRNSISPFSTAGQIGIVAQTEYAAFLEFGTVENVRVPNGLEQVAIQFKGRGIRNVGGIKPRLYLYPAFFAAVERLKSRLKQIIFDK